MTANEITKRLMGWCVGHVWEIVSPNHFRHGYECDVYRLLRNGFEIEYEVKVSVSDFKADFKKQGKHFALASGKSMNRFYFVVPTGMIGQNDLPRHAGLIYASERSFEIIKVAPLLHRNPVPESYYRDLAQKCAAREKQFRQKVLWLQYRVSELEQRVYGLQTSKP